MPKKKDIKSCLYLLEKSVVGSVVICIVGLAAYVCLFLLMNLV